MHRQGWDLNEMKSHDYQIMMQDVLPNGMRHLMEKGCKTTIIRVCHVFKRLCTKVVDPRLMVDLKKEVAHTLVLLKQEFPPFLI